ncbi:hypothetical protein SAMN05443637_12363 [Pseudonocardia thermophila]|jgi:hypothetical protein|uniref:Helix-hairpin-helix motif-containing protein n=2 Tax=Pseudonocardia thermophila TaxID=1848 RepID=A0A1M6ZDH7_PSETH|nr:hypothetical protein SAMN05443637_12363 [Pseudonocardia thermophila]
MTITRVPTTAEPGETMYQHAPPPPPVVPQRTQTSWLGRGRWYPIVVVLSAGILSFVPFVHAAVRTRRPLMQLTAVLYTAAVVAMFLLIDTDRGGGGAIAALMIIAAVHSVLIRPYVWPSLRGGPVADPAVAAALAARKRRQETRALIAGDPQLARELRIGRPDLPGRQYDDGGLVDLNNAPGWVIAQVCDIDRAVAEHIVRVRMMSGPFTTVDDVLALADVPYPLWDRVRERAVVIPI